ncbi:DUF2628 domain-containing protein [Sphingomonas sp. NBWT7]|uniref:DUF2628 domain-containing protein n=1 Tax=Sphingomonas sp. NBWT7 TaxID=2596913 RepID=UPI00162981BE|nr:DUF2628 domain-containing protein [Sphingomonas sp. NBWT7]QNE32513.1 DUF2628 domain-containing protein [Sphingomonas sp. NBWT7]
MDQSTYDKLERLANLHRDGALSAAEYDDEKAKLLSGAPPASGNGNPAAPRVEPTIDESKLAPIWQERFELIDKHGMPKSRAYTAAVQHLSAIKTAQLVMSPLAFLLGPLYYVYLGLWRPALSLCAATIAFTAITDALQVPAWFDRATYIIPSAVFAWVCVPLYYLRVRQGVHSWNPMIWWGAGRA